MSALTRQQDRVLALLAEGLTVAQAATRLGISPHTVTSHLRIAKDRLGARSIPQACVIWARQKSPAEVTG